MIRTEIRSSMLLFLLLALLAFVTVNYRLSFEVLSFFGGAVSSAGENALAHVSGAISSMLRFLGAL